MRARLLPIHLFAVLTMLPFTSLLRAQQSAVAPKSAAIAKAEKIILPKIEIVAAPVREVVSYLVTKSRELDPEQKGVNVSLKLAATDRTSVSLSLENVPLSEVLKYVAELAGLILETDAHGFVMRDATLVVSLPEPKPGSPESALLNRARGIILPRVQFKDALVAEAIEFLRVRSGQLDLEKKPVNVVVQPSGTRGEVRISLSLVNVSVAEALRYVAELAGLQLEVGPSALVLRPPAE